MLVRGRISNTPQTWRPDRPPATLASASAFQPTAFTKVRFLSVVLIAGLRKSTMKFFVVVFFFHRPMTSLKYRTGATEYHRQERPGMINAPLSTETCTHNTDKSDRKAAKPFPLLIMKTFDTHVLVFIESCSIVMARTGKIVAFLCT